MIELNITESEDYNRIGHYQFYKDEILIGKEITSDIFLPKESLNPHHAILAISDKVLTIEVLVYDDNIDSFIHVNGKRTTGIKRLKNSDTFKFGSTLIKVESFSKEVYEEKRIFLNNKVQQLQDENSPLLEVLQSLGNDEA